MKYNNLSKEELLLKIKSLEEIIDNMGSYVYAKDKEGRYCYVNKKVITLFEKKEEEILGKDDSHFFDLTISDQLKKNDLMVMQENSTFKAEEVNALKGSKELRTYHTIKKAIHNDNGDVMGMCGVSTDITEKKLLEESLAQQKRLVDIVINNVDAYIYVKDQDRIFRYVNDKTAEVFGLARDEVIDQKDTDVLPLEVAEHFWSSDKLIFEKGEKITINESLVDDKGESKNYLSVKVPFEWQEGKKALIGFSTDVTELYQLKESFKLEANTDSLTGLFNRRYFFQAAEREFHRAKRYKQPLSVISIDIDHFKFFNDEYGHPAGDSILIEVAKNIIPSIRTEDILARIGGEEFSIILPATSTDKAKNVAERIRKFQDKDLIEGESGQTFDVKISVGVATLKCEDESFQELYARSDRALYHSKATGRNAVHYID